MFALHVYLYTTSDNHAPVITGPTEVYVTTGETFTESYSAEDEDSHDITAFKLKVCAQRKGR